MILGYPENGPFDVQSGADRRTQTVITQNAYGHGPVSRLLTPLRGLVRPGNSGGPVLVDVNGQVLTTVFAATVGSRSARRLRRRQRTPSRGRRLRRAAGARARAEVR